MEHATKQLFYGTKGKGSFILDLETETTWPICTSKVIEFTRSTRIHVDEYWDKNKDIFLSRLTEHNLLQYNFCSSVHYANMASGEADLVLECTRKGNLEIASVFGLIKEAGGTILTSSKKDVSELSYWEFGQDSHAPVIMAASAALAKRAAKFFCT